VDASAVLAVLLHEEDAASFARAIESADVLHMSVVNYVEAAVRIDEFLSYGSSRDFDDFMRVTGIELLDVTPGLAEAARLACRRSGRRNQEASLNLGDCFAYALAQATGEPLLFEGADFAKTDVPSALWKRQAPGEGASGQGVSPALRRAARWCARSLSCL
jgi:ribonuclease VapC